MEATEIELILFDIGGVLIELTGVPTLIRWTNGRMNESDLWNHWLTSQAVRRYETGKSGSEEFAKAIIAELGLSVPAEEFLHEFSVWPKGAYPGAYDLLRSLAGTFRMATLCNTNEIHWQRYVESGLLDLFERHFASHRTGLIKPDVAAFQNVVRSTGLRPNRVLFLDDNQLNVDASKAAGMLAYKVKGVSGARAKLAALGVLEENYRSAEPAGSGDA
jgi:HAD superfamily hydrolase (TIGR01509 family)